jgi:hypothetical protein
MLVRGGSRGEGVLRPWLEWPNDRKHDAPKRCWHIRPPKQPATNQSWFHVILVPPISQPELKSTLKFLRLIYDFISNYMPYSINPSFYHSISPSFYHSISPSFHQSIILSFHQSIIPSFHHVIQDSLTSLHFDSENQKNNTSGGPGCRSTREEVVELPFRIRPGPAQAVVGPGFLRSIHPFFENKNTNERNLNRLLHRLLNRPSVESTHFHCVQVTIWRIL